MDGGIGVFAAHTADDLINRGNRTHLVVDIHTADQHGGAVHRVHHRPRVDVTFFIGADADHFPAEAFQPVGGRFDRRRFEGGGHDPFAFSGSRFAKPQQGQIVRFGAAGGKGQLRRVAVTAHRRAVHDILRLLVVRQVV